jgi:hypothetical protein
MNAEVYDTEAVGVLEVMKLAQERIRANPAV